MRLLAPDFALSAYLEFLGDKSVDLEAPCQKWFYNESCINKALNPKTLNPKPKTLNPKRYTPNPKCQNPKP